MSGLLAQGPLLPEEGVGALGEAMIGLFVIIIFWWAAGFARLAALFVRTIFGGLASIHIRFVGHPFGFLNDLANPIVHFFGGLANKSDAIVGWWLHSYVVIWSWIWHRMVGSYLLTWQLYHWIVGTAPKTIVVPRTRPIAHKAREADARSRAAIREADQARHREGALAAVAGATAGAIATRKTGAIRRSGTLPYWRWRRYANQRIAEATSAGTVAGTAAGVRIGSPAAFQARWSQLRKLIAAGGVGALVYAGLRSLDLGHLRCRNNRRIGKALCGFPSGLLEALLGGAIDALAVVDICRLAHLVTRLAQAFEPELRALVVIENAALCNGQHHPAAALPIRGQPWPVATTPIPL